MEDSTSTMGGRCEILVPADDEDAALEPQLELEDCVKCTGGSSCVGVADRSKIGCGSCNGQFTCRQHDWQDYFSIGENSCNGDSACWYIKGELKNVLFESQICNEDLFF